MTLLKIDLSDVLDEYHDDDAVVVWAPHHREGSRGQVVNTAQKRIRLTGGKAEQEVEPGPLMIRIQCRGISDTAPKDTVVPDQDSVTLPELLEQQFIYDPPVVSAAQRARNEAEVFAERAESGADRVGSAEQVGEWADESRVARGEAVSAAQTAVTSADNASASEKNAKASETNAGDSASSASSSATAASTAAGAAAVSEESANSSATFAGEAATAAEGAAVSAATSEQNASISEQNAAASAGVAKDDADRAERAAKESEAGVTDETLSTMVSAPATKSVLDRSYRQGVSVREYGATGDGGTDDTDAIEAAFQENPGQRIIFPPGRYRMTRDIAIPGGTVVTGAGSSSTVLDFSTKESWTNGANSAFFEWESGTLSDPTPVLSDIPQGAPSVQVAAGHPFAAGDVVRITSDEVLWGEAVKAEFQRVVQVEGSTLHLSGAAFDSYMASDNARVEKAHLGEAQMHGATIIGKGLNPASLTDDGPTANRGDSAINVTLARNVHFSDLRFDAVENRGIRLNSVFGAVINNCHWKFDPARIRLQYGVSVNGASQMVSMTGCSSLNDRHMITTSTSASLTDFYSPMRGIPRVITVTGCTAHGSWQNPIDTHRGGEYLSIVGNTLTTEATGVKLRGTKVTVVGNTMVGKGQSAYSTGLNGVRVVDRCQDLLINDNMIVGFFSGVRVENAAGDSSEISVSGNSILECTNGIEIVTSSGDINGVNMQGNTLRVRADGYPIYVNSNVSDLRIADNVAIGGREGIRVTQSQSLVARDVVVTGNSVRGQQAIALFLRNFSDATISNNHAPGLQGRLNGDFSRVLVMHNHLDVYDYTSSSVGVKKFMNGPDYT